jgi:hypothetical protein
MGWFIVILLLLAAAFGILAAVVKVVAFVVLTILLTIAVLATIAWYMLKHQVRRIGSQLSAPPERDDRY